MTSKFEIKIVLTNSGDKYNLRFIPGRINENAKVTSSSVKFAAMCVVFENIVSTQMKGNLELANIMSNMLMEAGGDPTEFLFENEDFH